MTDNQMSQKDEKVREFLSLLIDEKLSYSEIETRLGYQSGYSKVRVNRLKAQGYIEFKDGRYLITEKGNSLYRGLKRVITDKEQLVDIHFHKIKAKILEKNLLKGQHTITEKVETIIQIKRLHEQVKYSELNNNKIIIFENLYGSEIRVTTESVLIGIPKVMFTNLDQCMKSSDEYFKEIIPKIERFFDIKLDTNYINQFWMSSRHIEYINHKLALIHKRYSCMDIEILDEKTGERLLYFDHSGGKINAETASIRKGIEVAQSLEQFDRDIVDGHSLSRNHEEIKATKVKADVTFKDIKEAFESLHTVLEKHLEQDLVFKQDFNQHTALVRGAVDLIKIQREELEKMKKKVGQTKLGRYFG
jgi:Mn-dependent DtxR family transcriptional regulator